MIMSRFIRLAFSVGLAAAVVLAQPKPKSQKEVDAIMAMQNAQDADSRITAAQALITKFADTEFKPFALYVIASSYQQKNDVDSAMVWAEKTLEVDKANFMCMNMIASGLAQKTREFDLDKEEKLGRAEKMAKGAMEAIKTATKPNPEIPDAQWEIIRRTTLRSLIKPSAWLPWCGRSIRMLLPPSKQRSKRLLSQTPRPSFVSPAPTTWPASSTMRSLPLIRPWPFPI